MAKSEIELFERFILTHRLMQPVRIAELIRDYPKVWGEDLDEDAERVLRQVHSRLKSEGKLIPVRRGTYVLDRHGMQVATNLVKRERDIDNARLFLMKKQRKQYD